jgi:hypothetical protein
MTGNRLMVGVAAVVVVVVRQSPHRGEAAPPSAMKAQQWMCGNKSNRYGDAWRITSFDYLLMIHFI